MKIEDIKIGMKVRIREWDDMERERGLDEYGNVSGIFGFSRAMRKFCGQCYTVANIDDYKIKLDESFYNESRRNYYISAEMLEPFDDGFTMPPPPDLGELHGVKLPAWFWNPARECLIYILDSFKGNSYVAYFYDGKLCMSRNEGLEPYTGQDIQPKLSVDELKSLAGLVNNVR